MSKPFLPLAGGLLAVLLLAANAWSSSMDAQLSPTQKAIIPIAALAAEGDSEKLRAALEQGLGAGLTVSGIREVLIQLYAYAGFPRSLTALDVFRRLLEARKARGMTDAPGPEPKQLPPDADRHAIGAKIQTELVGRKVEGPIYEFAPAMDTFLKEHLFCDIFSREVLSWQDRELATISMLAALPAPAQLASHLKVCRHNGLSLAELRECAAILAAKVESAPARLMNEALDAMNP